METPELIFIPSPSMGHVAHMVELAKLMISQQNQLSITILVMKLPDYIDSISGAFIESVAADCANQERLHFFNLPPADPTPEWSSQTRGYFVNMLVKSQKPHVKSFIDQKMAQSPESKIVGIVVDMLCTPMMDVADVFGISSYVFLTSGAAFLAIILHFQSLHDEHNQDISEFKDSGGEIIAPGFTNPVPCSVLPAVFMEKIMWLGRFLDFARGYRRAKGIIINTFDELESFALNSLSSDPAIPPIYPVGPILNQAPRGSDKECVEIMKWLDEQPKKSVVFICFGSQGSLDEGQIKELARGIECSEFRFLWALRKRRSQENNALYPGEYDSYEGVLPEGYIQRTANTGKIVGWVPQLDVLSHEAVGGFVSHCGWNSTLESIWCGVPLATWPLHAEQQLNAFQLVKELNLAVEISLDYYERSQDQPVVSAEEIERGLRKLMEIDSETRKNVAKIRGACSKNIMKGGSSYTNLGSLIEHMITHASK